MNCVFQEQLDELDNELFDTGAFRIEEAKNVQPILTFVPLNLGHAWDHSQPCHELCRARASRNKDQTY